MTRAPRWSLTIAVPVVASLLVAPLACVLTCLLGGCAPSATARATQAAAFRQWSPKASAPAAANTPPPTESKPKPTARCCAGGKAKVCRPATTVEPEPPTDARTATSEPAVAVRQQATAHLTAWEETGCGCHHPAEPSRFTASQVFAPDAPPTAGPATAAAYQPTFNPGAPPRATRFYLPSRRETYLKCRVFRI